MCSHHACCCVLAVLVLLGLGLCTTHSVAQKMPWASAVRRMKQANRPAFVYSAGPPILITVIAVVLPQRFMLTLHFSEHRLLFKSGGYLGVLVPANMLQSFQQEQWAMCQAAGKGSGALQPPPPGLQDVCGAVPKTCSGVV